LIETIIVTLATIVLVGGIPLIILALCNSYLPSKWFCNKMGWHLAPAMQKFDGCSFGGVCPRCNKSVLKDSQGNWF